MLKATSEGARPLFHHRGTVFEHRNDVFSSDLQPHPRAEARKSKDLSDNDGV